MEEWLMQPLAMLVAWVRSQQHRENFSLSVIRDKTFSREPAVLQMSGVRALWKTNKLYLAVLHRLKKHNKGQKCSMQFIFAKKFCRRKFSQKFSFSSGYPSVPRRTGQASVKINSWYCLKKNRIVPLEHITLLHLKRSKGLKIIIFSPKWPFRLMMTPAGIFFMRAK